MQRVIAYVDGFNLYHGLRAKRWCWYYWLNLERLAQRLLKPGQQLLTTKYFTSIVDQPSDKRKRQAVYLEALQTLTDFHIYYGHFLSDQVICSSCGHIHPTYHEKMTDVNIAIELLADAFQDNLDTALLISADGDLVGPVQMLRRLFSAKRVVVAFPPARHSSALQTAAHAYLHIGRSALAQSVFPDEVSTATGYTLHRPASWR
jgi:uncharacterized LabA/DUF88 family protein